MTASGARAMSSVRAISATASDRARSRPTASALSAVSRAIAVMRSRMAASLTALAAQFAHFSDEIVAVTAIDRAGELDRRTTREEAAALDAQDRGPSWHRQQLRLRRS